ncbi:hypothetical protein [Sulfoacidibacillus thermotolerans]|uniref:Uncharacterized protein n=1 Tax=Sulfoacidibacillus thermotolerans TaxID=1765684 RepID=A0A2U3DC29_SULT2|nr:hypothetical protein [Sulfoacidibacillus thermotolerans]PWI58828.1 hypothetical protein BM613_01685 [Sulfoacidibacillus thermotolerans]
MAYRWSFERDPESGKMRERTDSVVVKTKSFSQEAHNASSLPPLPVVDHNLRNVLQHARELASTSDVTWGKMATPSIGIRRVRNSLWRRAKRQQRNYFKGNLRFMRDGKVAWSLREIAYAALSIGVTMGALLIAGLHFLLLLAPGSDVSGLNSAYTQGASLHAIQVQSGNQNLIDQAQRSDSVIVPALTTVMYEDGIFSTLSEAQLALQDIRHSGVDAVISPNAPYRLLLGPVLHVRGDQAFRSFLTRAEVPYAVTPYRIEEHSIALSLQGVRALSTPTLSKLEALVTVDANLLQALLALNSQYQVPQLFDLEAQSESLGQTLSVIMPNLGRVGTRIWAFHQRVQNAATHLSVIANAKSDVGKVLLVQAVIAMQKIG